MDIRPALKTGGSLALGVLALGVVQSGLALAMTPERGGTRITGTLCREVFDRLLIVNEHHLRSVLTEYLRQLQRWPAASCPRPDHAARADAQRPEPVNLAEHRIHRKQVLGGLTHEYYIAA